MASPIISSVGPIGPTDPSWIRRATAQEGRSGVLEALKLGREVGGRAPAAQKGRLVQSNDGPSLRPSADSASELVGLASDCPLAVS